MEGLLNTVQAAEILGLRPRTLESWRRLKRGPRYIRLPGGRAIRYRPGDIAEWVSRQAKQEGD